MGFVMKNLSPGTRYTIGFLFWMSLYMAAIVFDGFYFNRHSFGIPQAPWLYVFAVMPALPIGGTIWVFLRFLDESDEFVRAIMTRRFIIATGLTLFISIAWGFLQNYAGVWRCDLYNVYMLFWISFGVVSPFVRSSQ